MCLWDIILTALFWQHFSRSMLDGFAPYNRLSFSRVVMIRGSGLSSFNFKKLSFIHIRMFATQASIRDIKRKPPCIGGMELVSLSCNRVFISAESVERGWCKIAIATKWYQFHTTDACGFLFMPWTTVQYTFVRYTKLVNKIGTGVAKVTTFWIMTT